MPDPVTHYIFSHQVLGELPMNIAQKIDILVFDRALQGPDPWSFIGFYGGRNKKYSCRSAIMHREKTGDFLWLLAELAQKEKCDEVFTFLAGFLCHYCLDKIAHPYIICKGGVYDGQASTEHLKNGHLRMERAIDKYFIQSTYGKKPHKYSIPRHIMKLRKYPESMRAPLDAVFQSIYGWECAFELFNASLRDERIFYGLMQDPFGVVYRLFRPLSKGKTNYSMFSYFYPETELVHTDYLNEKHISWKHPYDESCVSEASFAELIENAKQDAIHMIKFAFEFIYLDKVVLLSQEFGNYNYSTGLAWDDCRNYTEPRCEPLLSKK